MLVKIFCFPRLVLINLLLQCFCDNKEVDKVDFVDRELCEKSVEKTTGAYETLAFAV